MEIVLYTPEIPQNTGNILRSAAVTGAHVSLIRPLGFSLSEKAFRRAGLDYIDPANYSTWESWDHFLRAKPQANFFFFSSKADSLYTSANYADDACLIFGAESKGIPGALHEKYPDRFYRIPMKKEARCLNLSSSVAIVLYEALRQCNFKGLK
jgi:tRNA (cytidine/uridine-2'-O-)-methyltransferase